MALCQADMQAVDQVIRQRLSSDVALVNQLSHYIVNSGGKRLRPLLVLLSAKSFGYQGDLHHLLAAIIEFIHTATLLHDDLVDEATLRRGQEVAHSNWGNSITVLVGDYLLARALSISAGTGRLRVVQVLAELTENMSQGEIRQLQKKGDVSLSEDDYLEVIRCKTAVLFQGACRNVSRLYPGHDHRNLPRHGSSRYGQRRAHHRGRCRESRRRARYEKRQIEDRLRTWQ